jgi:hypothetical protein
MQQLKTIAQQGRGDACVALSNDDANDGVCVIRRTGEACLAPTTLMLGKFLS